MEPAGLAESEALKAFPDKESTTSRHLRLIYAEAFRRGYIAGFAGAIEELGKTVESNEESWQID